MSMSRSYEGQMTQMLRERCPTDGRRYSFGQPVRFPGKFRIKLVARVHSFHWPKEEKLSKETEKAGDQYGESSVLLQFYNCSYLNCLFYFLAQFVS